MKSNNFCFFDDEVKQLRDSIESDLSNQYGYNYKNGHRDEVYAAIGGLIPDIYSGKGNPLDDKKFVDALKNKYKNAEPDPFDAFLDAAKRNLPAKYKDGAGNAYTSSGESHRFKNEESQYEKNLSKNSSLVSDNLGKWRFPSSKLYSKSYNTANNSMGEITVPHPLMTTELFRAGTIAGAATTADMFEHVIYFGENPSLKKVYNEITQIKEKLIGELPNDPEGDKKAAELVKIQGRLRVHIDKINRRVNRYQEALTFFDQKRAEHTVEGENEESIPNSPERVSNTINALKKELNKHVKEELLDYLSQKEKKIFFPNGLDLASMVMTDIRGENKGKKSTQISGGETVNQHDVTASTHACVKPAATQQQSK